MTGYALNIDDDVGRALFEACENSVEDETRIIAKAAKVIRKYIVVGDVSAERQVEPVQSLLISLISLILEGQSVDRKSVDVNNGIECTDCGYYS